MTEIPVNRGSWRQALSSPWRGEKFPPHPINECLFYLDVPNGNFPVRGWYVYRTNFAKLPTQAGDWIYCEPQPQG